MNHTAESSYNKYLWRFSNHFNLAKLGLATACAIIFHGNTNAATPMCYANADEYMSEIFGAGFRDDENLIMNEKHFGKQLFNVVEDLTSGTNHTRTLLRPDQNGQVCVVLTTAPTAQLRVTKLAADGVPQEFESIDQAPPGLPENVITYRLNPQTKIYSAADCHEVKWEGKRKTEKKVPCGPIVGDVLDEITTNVLSPDKGAIQ